MKIPAKAAHSPAQRAQRRGTAVERQVLISIRARRILPLGVFGSSSANSTIRGYL